MKASEKQVLYNLIKTSQDYFRFFSDKTEVPISFTDDITDTTDTNSTVHTDITEAQCSAPTTQTESATMDVLHGKVAKCTRCNLARTRQNTVFGEGVQNPLVMVIGEGPGADEDASGRPFVGKAGQLLDKMLSAISLSRNTNCYIANIVKCRPPQNRDPLPEERACCISFLDAQIHILKPKMILCVGKVASQTLLKTSDTVAQMRQNLYEYKGIPLMMTYHPSALLRDESLKRPAWEDLKIFKKNLDRIINQ